MGRLDLGTQCVVQFSGLDTIPLVFLRKHLPFFVFCFGFHPKLCSRASNSWLLLIIDASAQASTLEVFLDDAI